MEIQDLSDANLMWIISLMALSVIMLRVYLVSKAKFRSIVACATVMCKKCAKQITIGNQLFMVVVWCLFSLQIAVIRVLVKHKKALRRNSLDAEFG